MKIFELFLFKNLTGFILLIVFPNILFAQTLVNYSVARNTGITYTSISATGNSFSSWRNTTSFTQDDNRSVFTNIGFDFWYLGVRYTQFSVSTNGFIDFSTSTDDGGPQADDFGYSNAAFTAANVNNSTRPAIAPFYDDLTTQGGTDPIGTSIKYELSGAAPNRTLTVEWINMAVFGNVSPSLNFQVQLLESSGVIKINYGTMNTGSFLFSYSMGLNGVTISLLPTAAQLKMLQTVNGTTFNNTVQNNLSAMPTSNSQYVFTPVSPTPVSGSLSFSGVSQTGMTLNWSNWASNERGYVIYNSTDGLNFNFVSQTAINAVNSVITGLSPSTTYYWRVFAVTEGALSAALTGTQATLGAGNKVSLNSGNWNTANTWTPNGVPSAGDNVSISNGHLVNINTNAACNHLTVGAGTGSTLQFTGAARNMTVNGNLSVQTNGIFNINTGSNVTHLLRLEGNVLNNGTISFSVDANSLCNITFESFTNQTVSGTGTNRFNLITQNTGSSANHFLDFSCSTFTAANNFLSLNSGTFKLNTTTAVNITPFTALTSISEDCGIWINSSNAVVNTGAGIDLSGALTLSGGTLNIGNAANEDLFSNGGQVMISSGLLNIAGKYYSTGINNISNFSISSGTVIVPSFGSSSTTDAPFQVTGVGSEFDMSGGLIIIPREGGTGAQNLGFVNTGATGGSVAGGTLQIGNTSTPASQSISINSSAPIGNLLINSANANAFIESNPLQVINNIQLDAGSLNDNNLSISLGGSWTNNGGTFANGNGTVHFNSSSAESIFKSGGESFNNLLFSGTGLKTFSSPISAKGFTIAAGATVDVSPSNYQLNLSADFINDGSFVSRNGTVLLNGTVAQTIGGSSTSDFYNLSLNNTAGASLSGSENLLNTLTLSNGTFNTNGQVLTMVSTASNSARVAQITGSGDIIGNVVVQRFAPGGSTGWAFLGTPISSALTLQDWDDDIYISCSTCPDGSAGGFLSVYTYSEAATGLVDSPGSYVPLSGITDPIVFGKGYWVYLGNGQFTTSDITIDVTGSLRKFNQTIPLSYNNYGSAFDDGWNLIHNPYPSPISWTALRGATGNIDNAIYVYNADLNSGTGTYASFVNGVSSPAVGSGGIGDEIPTCQAFYVHSTGATSLNATEAIKVNSNPTFLKMNAQSSASPGTAKLLRLKLNNTTFQDECVVYTESNATNGFDKNYDAYKLTGSDPGAPAISLEKDSLFFQINGIPLINGTFSTNVKVSTGTSGNYSISATDFDNFPKGACLKLFDKYSNHTHDLRNGDYSVFLYDSTSTARFVLSIELNTPTVNTSLNAPTCSLVNGGFIVAQSMSTGPWEYTWKNNNGQILQNHSNLNTADTLKSLSGGIYFLELNSINACASNALSFTLPAVQIPLAQFICLDSVDMDINPTVIFTNNSINSAMYLWDFGDGNTANTASPVHTYSLSGYYQIGLISESPTHCKDSSYRQIMVYSRITGIGEQYKESSVIVYTLGEKEFRIQFPESMHGELKLELIDGFGKVVQKQNINSNETREVNLHLQFLMDGIYYLNIRSVSQVSIQKLPVF